MSRFEGQLEFGFVTEGNEKIQEDGCRVVYDAERGFRYSSPRGSAVLNPDEVVVVSHELDQIMRVTNSPAGSAGPLLTNVFPGAFPEQPVVPLLVWLYPSAPVEDVLAMSRCSAVGGTRRGARWARGNVALPHDPRRKRTSLDRCRRSGSRGLRAPRVHSADSLSSATRRWRWRMPLLAL